jgi:hypothetical protein
MALQFEYLMEDPGPRAQQYLDYTWVTKHRQSTAVANNPTGPISSWIAASPRRATGEARNKLEYDRVRAQFVKKGRKGSQRLVDNWHGMSIHDLADRLGRLGEYRLVYAGCSAWAHGDPFSTEWMTGHWTSNGPIVFIACVGYYARMLLTVADVGGAILTAEQHGFLKKLAPGFS